MKKKWIIFSVIVVAFIIVGILPHYARINTAVMHQHKSYPAENKEITGFDSNGNLTSHLPLIILKADGKEIPGAEMATTEELYCDFAVIDNDSHINNSADEPTLTGKMAINIRGNSSRHMKKKQYAIRTVDESGIPVNTGFFGMPPETSWVLNGSYIDYSQIRNYMLYNLSGEIMDYAPRCRFCEVFLTNANGEPEYLGLYTMIEKPNEKEARLNLTRYDQKFTETSFLLQMNPRIDNYKIEHLNPDEIRPLSFDLEYPEVTEITDSSLRYIKNEMLQFEKALYDAWYTGNWKSLEEKIDLESFIDYFIINEFFQNYDAGRRSTYLCKELGSKVCIASVWDFDGAFNNYEDMDYTVDVLAMKETIYYFYLCQNPDFVKKSIARYNELRKTVLSDQYLIEYIDASSMYLGSAALRNCARWYNGNYSLYKKDIEKMKTFVLERGKWMDENFEERTTIVK